jgi:uncharacterized protein (TIGR03437 family)
MTDGFSTYDFGDTSSPVNWWYDEYDFNLGFPLGPAARMGNTQTSSANLLANGTFESSTVAPWLTYYGSGGKASTVIDTSIAADGNASARVTVSSVSAQPWQITFEQDNISITEGATYQIQFWARSDSPRNITVFSQGGAPNYTNYGLNTSVALGPSWNLYTASFIAAATATDARLEFWIGDTAGTIWFDGVQFSVSQTSDLYRREFTNGITLLNATAVPQTVSLEPGLQRFSGSQAPRYQYIMDDSDSAFAMSGNWSATTIDSGFSNGTVNGPGGQLANGPYYHAWQTGVHQSNDPKGSATWNLRIPEDGQYTIQAWLPAGPAAGSWTTAAIYDVISGGQAIASVTLDQTSARLGDAWHTLGTWNLTSSGTPYVRIHNGASGTLVADALYVTSATLYNDGSAAPQVTLAPFDAILLQRKQPMSVPTSRVTSVTGGADYGSNIASGSFVSVFGTGFTTDARSWSTSDFNGNQLPTALDGVSVMINGQPAAVSYISPTQINVIAPDDAMTGSVIVQVTTPQGKSYPGIATKLPAAPAFFRFVDTGTTYVAALHADFSLVAQSASTGHPATAGEIISIYGTGFGPTSPATPSGMLVAQPNPIAKTVTVTIGGLTADVIYAGVTQAGVVQLNVRVPAGLQPGKELVTANAAGFQTSSDAYLAVGN